jgi:hypothetical protein
VKSELGKNGARRKTLAGQAGNTDEHAQQQGQSRGRARQRVGGIRRLDSARGRAHKATSARVEETTGEGHGRQIAHISKA